MSILLTILGVGIIIFLVVSYSGTFFKTLFVIATFLIFSVVLFIVGIVPFPELILAIFLTALVMAGLVWFFVSPKVKKDKEQDKSQAEFSKAIEPTSNDPH